MAAPTGWAWLAYTVDQAEDGPLRCVEATRVSADGEPTGVLSRWVVGRTDGTPVDDDALPDLVVESAVTDPRVDDERRAADVLRSWLAVARVALGDGSKEGFRKDLRVRPDTVERVPDVLVVDGVALPGTLARRGGLTARVAARGDHVLAVVHRRSVPAPVRLVTGPPRLLGAGM